MTPLDLPAETKSKLATLQSAIETALNSAETPHKQAVSQSLTHAVDDAVASDPQGGHIRVPGKPPLAHDKKRIATLHKEALLADGGILSSIVVHAHRDDTQSSWTLTPKLLSTTDYQKITADRHAIDDAVQEALVAFGSNRGWARISFGRDVPTKDPTIVLKATDIGKKKRGRDAIERTPPSDVLMKLLQSAEKLYSDKGFDLQVAYWTLRPGENVNIAFREYFE